MSESTFIDELRASAVLWREIGPSHIRTAEQLEKAADALEALEKERGKLRAILSAVMDVEKAEPTGDALDPTSWASAAKSVVAGSEHDRVREAMFQAHEALSSLRDEVLEAIEPFRLHRAWARLHSWPIDIAGDPCTPVLGEANGEAGIAGEVTVGDFDRIAALHERLSHAPSAEPTDG